MRLDEEYCLSEYVDLGRLGDNEKVHIVRNQVNGVIGVRKYVALDLEEIYLFLKENPNAYIPKIYECIQTDTNLIVIEEYLSGKNLEEMLKETIQQALDKNLIKSGTIIVDSTHTIASVWAKSPTQILRDMSKQLRKEVYKTAFELSERFPEKPSLEAGLDEEIAYTRELLQVLEEGIKSCGNKKIQKLSHEMKELLEDERLKEIRSKDDKDARFGHKTATSTFYGYKNHLAMTEERLIAGITVTDGGAPDGQELPKLIENAKENGIKAVSYTHLTLPTILRV